MTIHAVDLSQLTVREMRHALDVEKDMPFAAPEVQREEFKRRIAEGLPRYEIGGGVRDPSPPELIVDAATEMVQTLHGTRECPVCGVDRPHYHDLEVVNAARSRLAQEMGLGVIAQEIVETARGSHNDSMFISGDLVRRLRAILEVRVRGAGVVPPEPT